MTTESSPAAMNRTAVERKSDRELVVMRTFDAPALEGVEKDLIVDTYRRAVAMRRRMPIERTPRERSLQDTSASSSAATRWRAWPRRPSRSPVRRW